MGDSPPGPVPGAGPDPSSSSDPRAAAASARDPPPAVRPEPRRTWFAARAAPEAEGAEAHASREAPGPPAEPSRAEPRWRRRDLARVNRRSSPELRACARGSSRQPDAPPSFPLLRLPGPPRAPPGCRCRGRFPGTFQESASRDRGPGHRFKEAPAPARGSPSERLGAPRLRGAAWEPAQFSSPGFGALGNSLGGKKKASPTAATVCIWAAGSCTPKG